VLAKQAFTTNPTLKIETREERGENNKIRIRTERKRIYGGKTGGENTFFGNFPWTSAENTWKSHFDPSKLGIRLI